MYIVFKSVLLYFLTYIKIKICRRDFLFFTTNWLYF
ncbi:hypothetical protein SAMN05192553_102520 [Cyclobacterium xiamenense]|uniref:Uncharacterized protein n=1 Tax=Cyclobacterium xiamenense TaxID=1297121 RepID=A0A1H6W6G6_9BACT|nr:hypothetical protein SAMN05192553_102520 [Cyclobacterium xiamenense]